MKDNSKKNRFIFLGISLVFLCLVPVIFPSDYMLHIFIHSGIMVLLALGLGLIVGYAGQMSICHATFFAIGGYVSALLTKNWDLSFWIALPFAGLAASAFGLLLGYPSLRIKGIYFAIATLGFGIVCTAVIHNWISLTNGPMGISKIPYPDPLPLPFGKTITFNSLSSYYFLVLACILFCLFVLHRIAGSPVGRAFKAIREDEILAEFCGISLLRFKLIAFSVGCLFAGFAGSLYAHYYRGIGPDMSSIVLSFDILVFVIVGGGGTLMGPILGAAFLSALPEALRFVASYSPLVFSLLLLIVIIFSPRGMAGWMNALGDWIDRKIINK